MLCCVHCCKRVNELCLSKIGRPRHLVLSSITSLLTHDNVCLCSLYLLSHCVCVCLSVSVCLCLCSLYLLYHCVCACVRVLMCDTEPRHVAGKC